MLKVADIMTKNVLSVGPGASLDDVAWGLTIGGVTGAPVKDEHGRILGVISKSDLADTQGTEDAPPNSTAADAMTQTLLACREDESVREAAARMLDRGSHRLLVVDEQGVLVGIVTPMDVMRALVDGQLEAEDFENVD